MKVRLLHLAVLVAAMSPIVVISAEISIPLLVKNDVEDQQLLHFGLDPTATDTLDKDLGESKLPPFPPSDQFDARFIGDDIFLPKLGLGTYRDYRTGDSSFVGTTAHELTYQIGSGDSLSIFWEFPNFIVDIIQDFFGGVVVDALMVGVDSLSVPNPGALNKLRMVIFINKCRLSWHGLKLWQRTMAPFCPGKRQVKRII